MTYTVQAHEKDIVSVLGETAETKRLSITWCFCKDRKQPSSAVQTKLSLTRPCLNTTEIPHSFFKRNRLGFIMLIQPIEHMWAYRTASSRPIINISPVSKRRKELDKDTGQLCCCGGSIQNSVPIRYTHPECSKQIKSSGLFLFFFFLT